MTIIKPKISIITCTRNSAQFLKECLASIQQQTYTNFEHIIIDGLSIDKTLEIIKSCSPNAKIITQFPKGIYPAFNEGLRHVKGDIFGFLHADDCFADSYCLERIAEAFIRKKSIDYYCSKMLIYDKDLKNHFAILGATPHNPTFKEQLYSSTYFAHPTYYIRSSLIEKIGFFNEVYQFAGDIEWLFRLEKLNLISYFDPKPLIKFRSGGSTAIHYFKALKEEFIIQKNAKGFSIPLLIIYGWHFFRRIVRFGLMILRMNKLVDLCRKTILKFYQPPHQK